MSDLITRYGASMMPLFAPTVALERGEGVWVWDTDGTRYLDLLGGIAVNALGHAHPALVSAISDQAGRLIHISNLFASAPQVELAETLLRIARAPDGSGVFYTNSGAEANEAAFKIARRVGRPRVLALKKAFHGRTMGAVALTHKEQFRTPFEPLPGGVDFIPADDIDRLRTELERGDVAAVIAEPIQGEAGVLPLSADYLRAMRELTREHGVLMILDEIQTGIGRTGHWFAHQAHGIQPDVMTLAKSLGGGYPMGAVITFGSAATTLLSAGQHGTTFGGNPLGGAAGLAVIRTIEQEGLLENASAMERALHQQISALSHPGIAGVRGAGLLAGICFHDPIAPQLVSAGLKRGFILNAPDEHTLRLAPPLIITAGELAQFTDALPALITEVTP